ncbi:HlyD family efflux transporter periplasmic adaptor subunit [Budviciaceae bacterium CWB-B4]|uniref:HlyD family efflux transporter periplasmic adaptor subunit n=1 Tax=Limnobaculum xujianqingii TaxID=2738837 RepID=A0A9D7FT92_9GAMM|nr:HlyD family efflux transporter periplasmic adaptor subunit [Limnobaculum xujianqingii]MBK5073065.1 HlyD family efflux transporter periplasmic adaptor subunit [Limnobaculum xujianqingii]MBK5176374.1 HlyD family efflux transporter periplasmic adaptor subunit [Limnobaculum xujianqingii]
MGLFRQEALQAEKQKWLGSVMLSTPLTLRFFTAFVCAITVFIVLFCILFSYTRKQTVTGQLVPDRGVIKVYSPQYGVVTDKKVKEGELVKKGDVLYIISSERESQNSSGTQQVISTQIQSRLDSLNEDLAKNQTQFTAEKSLLQNYIRQLNDQVNALDKQIVNQRKILQLVQRRQQQYQEIYKKEYISLEQFERVKEELLQQQSALSSYEREKINAQKELAGRQSELDGLLLKFDKQQAQIDRNISTTRQELAESEAKREITIQAPQAGTITAAVAQTGQFVDNSKPMVSIVPENSLLMVHLYAPSNAVGFIQEGAEVWLRYQSYPYQKFGQYRGEVVSISKAALLQHELQSTTNVGNEASLYQIVVKPDKQLISVYGKDKALQPGMELEADITLDKRRLYEWVLEPLLSITKKATD